MWTSPFRLRLEDSRWLVSFAGATTGLIMTDRTTAFELSRDKHINLSNHIADAGVALAGAGVLGFYGLGRLKSNDHLRETGVLAGEAMLNSVVIDEVLGQWVSRLVRVRHRVHTIHGLYFPGHMRPGQRWRYVWLERMQMAPAHLILSQSAEDLETVKRDRIADPARARLLNIFRTKQTG